MSRKQKKVMTGLLTAAGVVGSIFGLRALLSRIRRRSYEPDYSIKFEENISGIEIPVMDMPEPNDFPPEKFSGTGQFSNPEAASGSMGQTRVGDNYQGSPEREFDLASIPTTGMIGAQVADMPLAEEIRGDYRRAENEQVQAGQGEDVMVETDQPVAVGSLVGPLIVHLLGFHNLMNLLQQRRDTINTTAASDLSDNMPDVRESGADSVGSLEAQLPEFDRSALVPGSLQERIIQVMERIREALQNTNYSEDDLFRIHGELRTVTCKVLTLIQRIEEDNVTGFEEAQKAYGCGQQ